MTEHHGRVYRDVTLLQRSVEWSTERLGTPQIVLAVLVLVAAWLAFNLGSRILGRTPFDPYPFPALQGLLAFGAFLMTLLILTTENRLAGSADQRSRLALQMEIVTEQKVAKIIALIEEQRRDDPNLKNRHDAEAVAMTKVADPAALSEALDLSHSTMLRES